MSILLVVLIIIPYIKQLTTQIMLSVILQISPEKVFWTWLWIQMINQEF